MTRPLDIPASAYRRCSKCGKQFKGRQAADQHIAAKHGGNAERVPVRSALPDDEPSMASQIIDAQLDYAMGEPVEDYLMEMFGDEITGGEA